MKRHSVNPSVDKEVFKRTAARTKEVNIIPRIHRGGFRF